MLKQHKKNNKFSYLTGLILLITILTTFVNVYNDYYEKFSKREYISTSLVSLFKNKSTSNFEENKEKLFKFYMDNKGKYVKWTLKADEVSELFNNITYYVNDDVNIDSNEKLKIKCKFESDVPDDLKVKDVLIISGQVVDYSELSKTLILKHCRIEKINK